MKPTSTTAKPPRASISRACCLSVSPAPQRSEPWENNMRPSIDLVPGGSLPEVDGGGQGDDLPNGLWPIGRVCAGFALVCDETVLRANLVGIDGTDNQQYE